jgi:hypothetical protein
MEEEKYQYLDQTPRIKNGPSSLRNVYPKIRVSYWNYRLLKLSVHAPQRQPTQRNGQTRMSRGGMSTMIRLHGHEFILAGKARKPENNTHQVLNTIDKDALRIGMNCLMHASANAFFFNRRKRPSGLVCHASTSNRNKRNNENENPVLPSAHSRTTNSSQTFPSPPG